MSRERITEDDINLQLERVRTLLRDTGVVTLRSAVEIRLGSGGAAKYHNQLIVMYRDLAVNIWPDGMGGYTKRDAWNALRLMAATLGAVCDRDM